jgi:DNA-binding NarL/FixJ family response regulator
MRVEDSGLINLLIVGDSHITRAGLRQILDSQPNIRVLGDISVEKASVIETLLGQRPDLILVELDSRGTDALGFIGKQALKKECAVLVLSDLADHELAREALTLGAAGLVLKVQPPAVMIAAIQDLCQRFNYESYPKNAAIEQEQRNSQNFFKTTFKDTHATRKIDRLTGREREIISLIAQGLKNKDIAKRLSISDITVRHHLTSIFCKLEVADRQKLLILAHRNGLADLMLCTEST